MVKLNKKVSTSSGIIIIIISAVILLGGAFTYQHFESCQSYVTNKTFVGPRSNVGIGAPAEGGFDTFAVVVPGVLSRSGQLTLSEFQWLKKNGWKSVVDLRISGDNNQDANDMDIKGFSDLKFKYLWLQITDGSPPTDSQAKQFLAFVTDPANQPVEIHCLAGVGRAGTMTALYRYQIQGWTMQEAISSLSSVIFNSRPTISLFICSSSSMRAFNSIVFSPTAFSSSLV
jgi:protein tyrosine phosphatase (PTP) superfamily phosphohydrolase (DUF442 family)